MMPLDQSRPMLMDLLYTLDRTTRAYRESLAAAPADIDGLGWDTLCDLSDRTAAHTRSMLERTGTRPPALDLLPPNPWGGSLASRLRERRERMASPPRPRRPGSELH